MSSLIKSVVRKEPQAAMLTLRKSKNKRLLASQRSIDGFLPLHMALLHEIHEWKCPKTSNQWVRLVKQLVKAFPESLHIEDSYGWLPLHLAAKNEFVPLPVVLFLADEYPEALSIEHYDSGWLPLHCFVGGRYLAYYEDLTLIFELLDHLIDVYPESLKHQDKKGNIPLLLGNQNYDLLKYLMNKNPALLLHKDQKGNIPLHRARDDKAFLIFAEKCPESLFVTNEEGQDPISTWLKEANVTRYQAKVMEKVVALAKDMGEEQEARHAAVVEELAKARETMVGTVEVAKHVSDDALNPDLIKEASIETLKSIAITLKHRLDQIKRALVPDDPPSTLQMMFPHFMNDPDLSKPALLDCIDRIGAEMDSLEGANQDESRDNGNDEKAVALNDTGSQSGFAALVAAMQGAGIAANQILVTGAHAASVEAVAFRRCAAEQHAKIAPNMNIMDT